MRRDWTPLVLGVGLFLLYTANGRPIGAGDVVPATFLPVALLRGDGPVLDRFAHVLRTPEGRLPGYAEESRGHAVSRYPIGPAILAAPLVLPQLIVLDRSEPGWEADRSRGRLVCSRMGKNAASAIVALSAVVMLAVLRRLGLGRVALPAVLIVALGTDDATVASQAPWQHGPAELCLALALLALITAAGRPPRLALAGLATAGMAVCRPIDVVPCAGISLWVLAHLDRRRRRAFFAPAILVALALGAYNLWFFDTLSGGYAAIERMHPWAHGTRGTWTAPFFLGAAGTLISPSHGLLFHAPWIGLALALLPWSWKARPSVMTGPEATLPLWLFASLIPTFILLSKYSCWWGGHCFGPRFWIDANPAFVIALALGLEWACSRGRVWPVAFALLAAWSVAIQGVGMLCYPSSWHGTPNNADRHHERLWDWSDSELTRCLAEGIRPRAW
jgi:hypothetical protein